MNRFLTLLLAASCLTAVGQYEVGDFGPAGGWIFYVDSDSLFEGWDYLECAPNVSCCFQPQGCAWPPYSTSTALGQGLENSFQWPDENPEEISTWDFTQAYNFGGHSDWFVPSKDELDVFLESSVKDFVLAEGQDYGVSSSSQYADCRWWGWSSNVGWNIGDEGWSGNKLILPVRRFKAATDNLFCDEGTVWDASEQKCVFDESVCGDGTIWSEELGGCIVANPSDSNFDGCVQLNDLLDLLSAYGDCGAEESPWQCGDTLEYQGYDYETVQIGEQCWFAENLRVENYRNGDAIDVDLDNASWGSTSAGASTVYGQAAGSITYDGSDIWEDNLDVFGRLYNGWVVTDERKICPSGWGIPDTGQWEQLVATANSIGLSYDVLRSTITWNNVNGTNDLGFSALAGGRRRVSGNYNAMGNIGYWWHSADEIPANNNLDQILINPNGSGLTTEGNPVWQGVSIRCIKDSE